MSRPERTMGPGNLPLTTLNPATVSGGRSLSKLLSHHTMASSVPHCTETQTMILKLAPRLSTNSTTLSRCCQKTVATTITSQLAELTILPPAMVSSPVHPASQEDGRSPRYDKQAGSSGPRRTKWTQGEEDILRRMKRKRCSWPEIEARLPQRSPASLRTRYSLLQNSNR